MKYKSVVVIALFASLTAAPFSPASAHGRFHGGPLLLPFVAVAAVVTGVALVATAPFRAVDREVAYDPRYAPQPQVYAEPPPRYYQAYPVYYSQPAYGYYRPYRAYY
jgi:hypothetical protein